MELIVRGQFVLRGTCDRVAEGEHVVVVSDADGPVTVRVSAQGQATGGSAVVHIDADVGAVVSAGAAKVLADGTELDDAPDEVADELLTLTRRASAAATRVGELIKFGLHHHRVHDHPIASRLPVYKRRGDTEWAAFPARLRATLDQIRTVVPLDSRSVRWLQTYLDEGFRPFVAMRHLHRAENDDRPWAKWIEATVAAELAIKEYLSRRRPELETLLVHLPSPPLGVLYGKVLGQYGGFKATRRAQLIKGAEIRNKLLHQPIGAIVSAEDAQRYVADVRFTILELLLDLYPDDPVLRVLAPTLGRGPRLPTPGASARGATGDGD